MTDLVTRMAPMTDVIERKRGVEAEREPNFLLAPFEPSSSATGCSARPRSGSC
jgi:hypothetical protein